MAKRSGRRSAAQTPAPKAEQIKGSKKNPKGSASSESSAAKIKLSEKTIDVLKNKLKDFKEKYPSKKNVSLGDLKAVYRRGSGAYSKSHRPTITGGKPNSRAAWSFARVNKFLEKAAGKPVKKAYVQDDDLLENGGTIKQDSLLKAVLPEVKRIFNANGLIINDDYSFTDGSNKSYLPYLGYMREGDKIKKVAISYYEQGFEILGEVVIEVEDDKIEIEVEFPNWNIDEEVEFADGGQVYGKGGLIAPNGKPSNLTPEQYNLVRTPEFKAWFGDWENDPANASKVVDENGEPLVVYHGSRSNFSIFDIGKSGESSTPAYVGFWFTPIKNFAYNFASTTWYGNSDKINVYPSFLSIKNPKIYNSDTDSDVRYPDSYQKFKIDIWALDGQDADRANVGGIGMMLNNRKETIKKYRELLENEGFDGIFINKTRFDRGEAGGLNDQIVALFPNQIKLADGTNKTFDMNNPDIRFDDGGEIVQCVRCEWTWSTADSDPSDMYVCHKCGFDNSLFYDGGILKPNLTLQEIAEKHNVELEYVIDQLFEGTQHELEHTENTDVAKKIALHHLAETPDYYQKLKTLNLEDGGDIEEDLFENYESLPAEVQEVLSKYSLEDETYENMENLLAELKPLGYTFEYGLDATPFGLKKMENGAIVEEVPEVEIEAYLMQQRAEAQDVMTCTDSRIFKTMICKTKIEIAEKRMSETDNPEELNVWNECIVIWSDCLNDIVDNNIPVREYKDGGKPCGCGQLYAKGGLAYGNSHDKGGIPLKVSSTGQNIEIEGGEGVVNKRSMQMTKKLEFEGKELTPCEVVSKINEMGGGVKFKCADVQEIIAEDGHF